MQLNAFVLCKFPLCRGWTTLTCFNFVVMKPSDCKIQYNWADSVGKTTRLIRHQMLQVRCLAQGSFRDDLRPCGKYVTQRLTCLSHVCLVLQELYRKFYINLWKRQFFYCISDGINRDEQTFLWFSCRLVWKRELIHESMNRYLKMPHKYGIWGYQPQRNLLNWDSVNISRSCMTRTLSIKISVIDTVGTDGCWVQFFIFVNLTKISH